MHAAKAEPAKNSSAPSIDEISARLLQSKQDLEVDKLFRAAVKIEASDLHLKVGSPPMVRSKGDLKALNRGPIDTEEMVRLLIPMLDDRNRRIFEEEGGADFSYTVAVDGVNWRFRVNMLKQLGRPVWWLDASTTLSRTSKGFSCRRSSRSYASTTKGWCSWRA